MKQENTPQSTSLFDRFRQSAKKVAPEAMAVATVAVLAATPNALEAHEVEELRSGSPALAMEMSDAEVDAMRELAIDADIAIDTLQYRSNRDIEEPGSSGLPPVIAQLDLTDNTLVWLDEAGNPTYAPERLPQQPIVRVVGSSEERYTQAETAEERAALMGEPTRVLLSKNSQVLDEAMVIQLRGAPGDPRGFPQYAEVRSPAVAAGELDGDAVSREDLDAHEVERRAALEREREELERERERIEEERARIERERERQRNPSAVDKHVDRASGIPGRVADNAANRAVRDAEWYLQRAVDRAVRDRIRGIFNR